MKRTGKVAAKLLLGLCLTSGVVGGVAVKYADHLFPSTYAGQWQDAVAARQELAKNVVHANGLSEAFTSVAKAVRPSVVHISAVTRIQPTSGKQRLRPQIPEQLRREFGMNDDMFEKFFEQQIPDQGHSQHGQGTGFIISKDGYILTNNHVVRGANELTVKLSDGRQFTGKMIGQDDKTDVAVIKINATNLMPVELGDSDSLQVGEWVLAIGSPFGLEQTVTAGIISAKGRGNVGITDYEDFLQTDAAINPGNSGGPMVNMQGQVVGINTAIASRTGGSAGVGFAIPSSMVKGVAESLMKDGKVTRGWLGAAIQDLNTDLAKSFNYDSTEGVLIGDVVPDSPAAKAGLKAGDIVVKLNGRAMYSSSQLRNTVSLMQPKTSAEFAIYRDGKSQMVTVTIGTLDANASLASTPSVEEATAETTNDAFGISVQDLTADMAQELNLKEGTRGVVVVNVEEDSLAANAGLSTGDMIVSVAGQAVKNVAEYRELLEKHPVESGVRMQVSRNGITRFVFLRTNP